MRAIATIGYQAATMPSFLRSLGDAKIDLLVDIRAVASSRRPGFSKTALAANLREAGIDYLHLRGLGTPADGRAAARAGKHEVMRQIFLEHIRIFGFVSVITLIGSAEHRTYRVSGNVFLRNC